MKTASDKKWLREEWDGFCNGSCMFLRIMNLLSETETKREACGEMRRGGA
jgi:hypothetical protein